MPHEYILAHDLGTTGNKTTLFDADTGSVVASVAEPYGTDYPQPNWAEQNAADWERAVLGGTQRLLDQTQVRPQRIAVVSFSGTMNGALPVDEFGAPLRPAIIWADQRATAQAARLGECCGGPAEFYRRTGHRPGASYTAAKIMWLREHQPEVYDRACKFLQAKDYAAYLLTGVFATDFSDASGTNLFDLERREWAPDLIRALELDAGKLPNAYPSSTVVGQVTPEAAAETGLLYGTPVVIGGGDGACATVGAGSVKPGDAYNYIGSSSWIAVTTEQPLLDPEMRTFTFVHLDPRFYFPTGTMQAAGGSFDWIERLLRGESDRRLYNDLNTLAAGVPVGAGGLLFLPYLMGERSPYWNPLARGCFVGLSMGHGRAELTRAVLEGVALNLMMILDAFLAQGAGIETLRVIGGGARSALWRQILADVYGMPVLRPHLLTEATALGAAIAGGVGVGLFENFEVVQKIVRVQDSEQPDPAAQARYAELYGLFKDTYRALEPVFTRLAELQTAPE